MQTPLQGRPSASCSTHVPTLLPPAVHPAQAAPAVIAHPYLLCSHGPTTPPVRPPRALSVQPALVIILCSPQAAGPDPGFQLLPLGCSGEAPGHELWTGAKGRAFPDHNFDVA